MASLLRALALLPSLEHLSIESASSCALPVACLPRQLRSIAAPQITRQFDAGYDSALRVLTRFRNLERFQLVYYPGADPDSCASSSNWR
jgi:hypothetical protein